MAKFGYMHLIDRVAFENGLQYRHFDSKIFNGNILATFCANMMKIGVVLVTPEITMVTNGPLWMRRQKIATWSTHYLLSCKPAHLTFHHHSTQMGWEVNIS